MCADCGVVEEIPIEGLRIKNEKFKLPVIPAHAGISPLRADCGVGEEIPACAGMTCLADVDRMPYYVYIMSNKGGSTLYIGMTNDLERRVYEHKTGAHDGFTKKYKTTHLVHVEEYDKPFEAITREKQLKRWKREWKDRLIDEQNPSRKDLSGGWFEDP